MKRLWWLVVVEEGPEREVEELPFGEYRDLLEVLLRHGFRPQVSRMLTFERAVWEGVREEGQGRRRVRVALLGPEGKVAKDI
ncbi:MAG: hypothetical protein QXY39_06025 [Thermofilaceae archaeon]